MSCRKCEQHCRPKKAQTHAIIIPELNYSYDPNFNSIQHIEKTWRDNPTIVIIWLCIGYSTIDKAFSHCNHPKPLLVQLKELGAFRMAKFTTNCRALQATSYSSGYASDTPDELWCLPASFCRETTNEAVPVNRLGRGRHVLCKTISLAAYHLSR